MKRMVALAVAFIAIAAFAQSPNDEKVIRELEQEWPNHIGGSQADIDFQKRVTDKQFVSIDNVGRITSFTLSDIEAMAKADPDVKSSGETTNLKIQFYGSDTAIATYNAHFKQTGHKDKKFDLELELACLDVWKKINGQWKAVGGTNTSTKPLSPEMYKMAPPPGTPIS
jgi:hypothetical protein